MSNMGTVNNIFVFQGIISHMLNEGKHLYSTFIDFIKVFDYVVKGNSLDEINKLKKWCFWVFFGSKARWTFVAIFILHVFEWYWGCVYE